MGSALLPLQFNKTAFISSRLLSLSPAFAPILRPRTVYDDASQNSDDESAVYRRVLKLQRPTTVRFQDNLPNFVSLIGAICKPLIACNHEDLGVYTSLSVKAPGRANRDFWIGLKFWNEMAEVSVQHLKLGDLVYVSGRLGSHLRLNDDGSSKRYYEVVVKEMNFVAQNFPGACQNIVNLEPTVSYEGKRRNRFHLWQVFFANPSEWWDNRNSKLKPEMPDFKHKDTGEALWIQCNDPPWINEQLQLRDSRLSGRSQRNAWSHVTPLVFDELESN